MIDYTVILKQFEVGTSRSSCHVERRAKKVSEDGGTAEKVCEDEGTAKKVWKMKELRRKSAKMKR